MSGTRYRETVETVLADILSLYPEHATALGEHRHDGELDDMSDDGRARKRARLAEDRDALDALDLDALDPEDAVDAQLVRTGIDGLLFSLDGTADHTWNPLVWLPGEALFPLVEREGTPVADRLRALASRMSQVPDRLAQARKTVERPPRVHVETAVDQTTGAAALLGAPLEALLAQEPGLRPLVEPARDAALKALAEHRDALAAMVETADGDPRLGEQRFAAKLHLTLDSDLSAAEVTRRAEQNLALVEEQLRELSGGDVRAAFAACAVDVPNDDDVLERAQEAFVRAREHVIEHDLVTLYDDPYEWVVMPEFRRGVAIAYCDSPGPLEPPGLATQLAVAPTPAHWSPERVASFYREYNLAMLADLVVHEAMPGHLVQLDHARRFQASTRARQIFDSGPFIEGWAVHAERLMAESGCGGERVRLQQLKMQLRMSINALLDAGVHAGGMTEGEAMELMMGRGFQEEGEAVGKWRRALLTSTQLSTYFVGYIELDDLFRRLGLDASSNYDHVLAHGSPPVRHLAGLLGA
ncbi:MAG TPA: DUF885 domain-containing protein [Mycobacteriales bacterium]|nr:DUF885 domain-containing protein [Mycobacteriales bacterium]